MKDYSDFISKGKRPFWKHKEYLKYIETLRESQAIDYEIGLIKYIENMGVPGEARTFIKKLRYTETIEGIIYLDGGNFNYDVHAIRKELKNIYDKYFTKDYRIDYNMFKYYYNYKYWDNGLKGDDKRILLSVNKMKFKDHSKEFEFLMDFQNKFQGINTFNYSNPKAAKYLKNTTDISFEETTILMYLKRRKKK